MAILTDADIMAFDSKSNAPKVLTDADISGFDSQKKPMFANQEQSRQGQILARRNQAQAEINNTGPMPYINALGESVVKTGEQLLKSPISVPSQALTDIGNNTPLPQKLNNTADVLTGKKESNYGTMLEAGGVPNKIAKPVGAVTDFVAYPGVGVKGVVDIAKAGVGLAKAGGKVVSDIASKNLDNRIFNLYNSSVGAKLKNLGDTAKIQPRVLNATKAMSDNLPNIELPSGGQLPQDRGDLAHVLKQTKQDIYKKYTKLSGDATESGAQIQMAPLVEKALNDTVKSIGEDALKADPQLLNSIIREAKNASNIGITTPTRAQEYMQSLNKELSPLYASGKGTDYSVLDFKRNLINHLNDATESTIENTLSKSGYGDLRDQYAALKSSEKEILNAANKYLKKQGGVSHPIVNLWSIEEAMQAAGHAATGNLPAAGASLFRSAAIKTASKLADFMGNPDRKITKMFELLEKYKGGIKPGSGSVHVDAELMGTGRIGYTPAKPKSITDMSSRPVINQSGYIPPGLPKPSFEMPVNRGLPSPQKAGSSSGPVIKQSGYVPPEPKSLPFYSMDESGRIKGDGFLLGEKRLTANDVNDKLIMAEKPVDAMGNIQVQSHADDLEHIKIRAEQAKEEIKMLTSFRKDISGKIDPKEFKQGEFIDSGKKLGWASKKNGSGIGLDDKATEIFNKYPELYPRNFKGSPGDALGKVIEDITLNKGKQYISELRGVISSSRKIKK